MKFCQLFLLLIVFNIYGQKQNQSIGFIENKGQIVDQKGRKNNGVKYLLNTNGLNVQLRKNGFSYDVYETKKHPLTKKQKERLYASNSIKNDTLKNPNYTLEYLYHRVDIDFENSNQSVKLIAEEKSSDYDNYYNIPNEPNGITNVHKFQKVTYKNIYNNIDVVFFIPEDKSKPVEYNFIVNQGGKIADIQLKFNGVKTELIANKIKMNVRFGQMEETLPLSWSENGTTKNEIAIGYKKIKNNVYGFESSEDLNNKKVVIDPVPVRLWGTYCGGDNMSLVSSSINTDSFENVILTGSTYCRNIATSGAFITSNSNYDESGFIIKFNQNGQRIWASYIKNGNLFAKINDAKINSNNEIYIVGKTWDGGNGTNNLATPNSHKQIPSILNLEGFILKFDNNGLRIWGTFFGGDGYDEINTLLIDTADNILICGSTDSNSGISLPNGFLPNKQFSTTFNNGGFFCKFSPTGTQLYGSYFYTSIYNCVKDSNNNYFFSGIYVMGNGYPNFTTTGCHQSQYYNLDSYLVKFNSSYNIEWCTYYGGNGYESVTGLGTDNQNNIYLIGTTNSLENISTLGSFKETLISGENTYIAKFNNYGQRIWGTYFGRDGSLVNDKCNNGFVRDNGDIYITGETRNYISFPELSTPNSFQPISNGSDEGFFAKFSTNGNLSWCSYYGTPSQDFSQKIYYKNYIYISGYSTGVATNGNNLGTPGTFMPNGGGYLLYLAKFQDCISSPQISSNTPACIGTTLNLTASGGTNYSWTGPNGFTSNQQNPTITNVNSTNSGQYSCLITGTGGCDGTNTINVVVGDNLKPIPNINPLPTITGDCNTTATAPTATDNCAGTITATTSDALSYSLPGTYTIHWNYNDGNGNIETQTQNVSVTNIALPMCNSPQIFCIKQNATLNSIPITGLNIKWYDAITAGNLLSNSTLLQHGITYYASQTVNGCESLRNPVSINIENTSTPTGTGTQTFCSTQNATLSDISIAGSNINWYNSTTNPTVLSSTTILTNGTTYYASQTINGCESLSRLPVTVSIINSLNANDYSQSFCDDLNDGSENVLLTDYNSNLVTSTTNTTFTYYPTLLSAQNQVINQQLNSNYSLNLGLNTIYVRLESTNGCHQIVKLELTLFPKPTISINDVMPICKTNNIIVDVGAGFNSYSWSTGATTQSITLTQAGNYSVTVTQNHGGITCTSIKNFTVVLSNIATIATIETQDWTDNENIIIVNLTASSIGNYEYSLNGIHYQDSNIFSGLYSGNYTVYVHDKNECGIATKDVFLLTYPKFFTPNCDGNNDTWKIKFSQYEPGLKVKIFDRYGKHIKSLEKTSSWDGTNNGELMLSDDYWFIVTRANGKEHKGHFTLKR